MSQLTLYNAARPPPGPPELRRLRSVGRVPPPGILRRFTPARNRAGSGPFCILPSRVVAVRSIKFLTVRNLIPPSPRRSYNDVSVNSLQCAQPLSDGRSAAVGDLPAAASAQAGTPAAAAPIPRTK